MDLCTENALWHRDGSRRRSMPLDLEFAVVAPVELDANELLGAVYGPDEEEGPLPDPGAPEGRGLLKAATSAVFPQSVVDARGWDGCEDFIAWRPYPALTALVRGGGGYLAPVLALLA